MRKCPACGDVVSRQSGSMSVRALERHAGWSCRTQLLTNAQLLWVFSGHDSRARVAERYGYTADDVPQVWREWSESRRGVASGAALVGRPLPADAPEVCRGSTPRTGA